MLDRRCGRAEPGVSPSERPGASMAVHRSRRRFLGNALTVAATSALLQAQPFVKMRGWLDVAQAAPDITHDTVNGLFAFVLPGSDAYSIAQGMSTADEGGVDAGAT